MRISDWSQTCALPISESDWLQSASEFEVGAEPATALSARANCSGSSLPRFSARRSIPRHAFALKKNRCGIGPFSKICDNEHTARSEEHTSELQSLMRISYAVFCLQKKKKKKLLPKNTHNQQTT